ncbi:hypothetical protein CGCA056_v014733 [Colletotrichum aenigma]|uniref:uncharacterized protein n=1 Tax=Colletotrichum aenigma TaxID=1215731 RepID=UPI00187237B7|nr:uncharacterized protein CGCA056_v014733 [Colletotrichum aenigma]KAF5502270.1 hypothetical protein CGCA056_v014733 [Colletotrichum aenigma]
MKSAAVFMILAATTVAAICFSGGMTAEKGKFLKEEIKELKKKTRMEIICNAIAGNGKMKWHKGEQRRFCLQEKDGLKWDFMLKYINWGTNTIKTKECMNGMEKEAYGCKHGGQTGYWNWEYMADPNQGYCEDLGWL